MLNRWLWLLNFGVALGAGLIAGVFFAFSSFVLPALRRLPSAQGMSAMQSINVVVLNRWFLGVFLGTALGCALLLLDVLVRGWQPGAKLRLAGALSYLVGGLLVTRACNVPYNERLASLLPQSAAAVRGWHEYVVLWGLWNYVRGAACFGAAAALMLALLGCSRHGSCAPVGATSISPLPERLSQTGCSEVADPRSWSLPPDAAARHRAPGFGGDVSRASLDRIAALKLTPRRRRRRRGSAPAVSPPKRRARSSCAPHVESVATARRSWPWHKWSPAGQA